MFSLALSLDVNFSILAQLNHYGHFVYLHAKGKSRYRENFFFFLFDIRSVEIVWNSLMQKKKKKKMEIEENKFPAASFVLNISFYTSTTS